MKEVIISITGTQTNEDGLDDSIELITAGEYNWSGGSGKFTYMESELTGLEGTKTSFTVEDFGVTMSREGRMNSQMIFQEGKKHHFLYETPFGSAMMGIETQRVVSRMGEHGGFMEIDYVIDFDHNVVGRNKFVINIRER